MSDFVKQGYWSIATQKHLRKFTVDSPNLDEFEKLNISGKSGRLLGILRGNQQIDNVKKLGSSPKVVLDYFRTRPFYTYKEK